MSTDDSYAGNRFYLNEEKIDRRAIEARPDITEDELIAKIWGAGEASNGSRAWRGRDARRRGKRRGRGQLGRWRGISDRLFGWLKFSWLQAKKGRHG